MYNYSTGEEYNNIRRRRNDFHFVLCLERSERNAYKDEKDSLAKKIQNYYLRILFYAFLSEETEINNFVDVIDSFDHNKRLAEHLGIVKSVLLEMDKALTNPGVRGELDNKISNANALLVDDSIEPSEKVARAIKSFKRISESEIFTHRKITELMVGQVLAEIDFTDFNNNPKLFIDIVSKSGIYPVVLFDKLLAKGIDSEVAKNCLYAVATSPVAYEFTRKVYELMGFPVEHILDIELASSNDLINEKEKPYVIDGLNQYYFKGDEKMKFDVIIGNPPYQEMDGGAQASASPIYHHFVRLAKELNPELMSFIMPTRWYAGGKGLDDFRDEMIKDTHLRELHDWLTPEDIFPNTNIRGGVCYFLWDKNYNNSETLTRVVTHENNIVTDDVFRAMEIEGIDIFVRDGKSAPILDKVFANEDTDIILNYISPLRPFGFRGYFTKDEKFRPTSSGLVDPIICYGKGKAIGYLERDEITVHSEWVDAWKLYTPRANNIGTELNDDNLNTFVGAPKTICTESYLVIGAELGLDEASCQNLSKYFKTKFVRYLHGLAKGSHDATSKTFRFVPVQDFSKKSDIDWSVLVQEVDKQLYEKYGLSDEEINHIERRIKKM